MGHSAIIKAYARAGKVRGVRHWLGQMQHASLASPCHVYEELLQYSCVRDDTELTHEVVTMMRSGPQCFSRCRKPSDGQSTQLFAGKCHERSHQNFYANFA